MRAKEGILGDPAPVRTTGDGQIARVFVPLETRILKGLQEAEQPRLKHLSLGRRQIGRGETFGQALKCLHDRKRFLSGVMYGQHGSGTGDRKKTDANRMS